MLSDPDELVIETNLHPDRSIEESRYGDQDDTLRPRLHASARMSPHIQPAEWYPARTPTR